MNRETRARLQKQAREATAQTVITVPGSAKEPIFTDVSAERKPRMPREGTGTEKPAKKPPAAPPVQDLAKFFASDMGPSPSCCACSAPIMPEQLVQQTKRGRWRHVTCPARPAKPQKVKPRFQHGAARLPEGSEFTPSPLWSNGFWTGGLRIGFDGPYFIDKASGVFKLLEKLDLQYRQSLLKPVETAAPVA